MDVLRNSHDIDRIGVYEFGGVGKTTIVKEVSRQATGDKELFADVVMILDRLWDFLVWRLVKVLLTSRMREVLSREMHTHKEFLLDLLGEEETWNLFEKKAGDVIKNPEIKTVAIKVAKRCGDLPVLVVTVASALKNRRTLHAWKDALRCLIRFDKEEFTEMTYLALEWSYSQLNDEEKPLFLLCGFYANSWKTIYIDYLLKYGIGLGLFKNFDTMGEAWDALNSLLEKLKDSCLLLDHEDSGCVKMHDLVHDVAKRILCKDQHVLKISGGDELKEWPDNKDFCEKCTMISLRTSNIPKLPEVLQCKEPKMFYFNSEDYSLEIQCNFFKETTKLEVLDLTDLSIPSLPPSLQFLKSLKTLCLDWCTLGDIALIGQLQNLEMLSFLTSKFKELPKEIGQLTNLRSLDLTGCFQLELISPNVISNLTRLEELKVGNSFNRWEAKGVNSTKKSNASLSELKNLSKLSALEIHILDANILPTGLFPKALKRYRIYISAVWNWNNKDANLNTLKIKLTTSNELYQSGVNMLLKRTDELHLNGMKAGSISKFEEIVHQWLDQVNDIMA
ncbi:disease resistance protein At4g27190-like [Rosa chinensis]|uniref:disease resistance protein At4g27190-like n=1 Tax=Rosa chinensis TaxID=74649 RepID=UPI000D08E1EC|nr:disease resistance protein At4g27190-like [Rosa chinensis]